MENEEEKVVDTTIITKPEEETLTPTDDIITPDQPVVGDTVGEPALDTNPDGGVVTEPIGEPVVPVVTDEPVVAADTIPTDDSCCAGCATDGCTTICHLFGTLQECVTIVWRFHLKTRKHHIHVTLNEFYDSALDIVDKLIEEYQGCFGVIEEPFVNCIVGDGKTEVDYLNELKGFVESNRGLLAERSELNSTLDEFISLLDSTIYKLTSFCENVVKSFDEFCYEDLNESACCDKGLDFEDNSSEEEEEE